MPLAYRRVNSVTYWVDLSAAEARTILGHAEAIYPRVPVGAETALAASAIGRELVSRFRQRLAERIRLERLLVFGSRARGTYHPHSDYDLIVVSPDFAPVSPLWRGHGLNLLWNDLEPGVDAELVCLTPDEFAAAVTRPTSWLHEAAGKAVAVRPLQTIDQQRLQGQIGTLGPDQMAEVDRALHHSLGLS